MSLDIPLTLPEDAYDYGERSSGETHGVVLTKPHVVNLILDLAGYTVNQDLTTLSLLEPACGHGAFLAPAVERLVRSARQQDKPISILEKAVLAFDIDPEHVIKSREVVSNLLVDAEVPEADALNLAAKWIHQGDFLLAQIPGHFDAVVGNPPYIRIEQLSPSLQKAYRQRYPYVFDRADIYVAFIARGLELLSGKGTLSFICSDRWVRNKYGAPLRRFVTENYRVRCYIDLHQASPFESEVIAYPSIFSISRGKTDKVHLVTLKEASPEECKLVLGAIDGNGKLHPAVDVAITSWFEGDSPWVINSPSHLEVLRALEAQFPLIDTDGITKVGIGVATGADKVFIVNQGVDIEPDRLVPLVMRADIERGRINNAQRYVINAFRDDGGVIDLKQYPRLGQYLGVHGEAIKKRHVAQKNPSSWFRTIDRVYPSLVTTPKLLIPDIAGSNEVVYDEGHYHPHHNLYFVTSKVWDMEVLGALLSSKVALFFVWSYAVKMRGDYMRFQAQYLRRIRLPKHESIPPALADSLRTAFRERDFPALDALAIEAYGRPKVPVFDFVETRK